jgi:hypothetical protein
VAPIVQSYGMVPSFARASHNSGLNHYQQRGPFQGQQRMPSLHPPHLPPPKRFQAPYNNFYSGRFNPRAQRPRTSYYERSQSISTDCRTKWVKKSSSTAPSTDEAIVQVVPSPTKNPLNYSPNPSQIRNNNGPSSLTSTSASTLTGLHNNNSLEMKGLGSGGALVPIVRYVPPSTPTSTRTGGGMLKPIVQLNRKTRFRLIEDKVAKKKRLEEEEEARRKRSTIVRHSPSKYRLDRRSPHKKIAGQITLGGLNLLQRRSLIGRSKPSTVKRSSFVVQPYSLKRIRKISLRCEGPPRGDT